MSILDFSDVDYEIEKAIKSKDKDKIIYALVKGWKADSLRILDDVNEYINELEMSGDTPNNTLLEDQAYYTKLSDVLDAYAKKLEPKRNSKRK